MAVVTEISPQEIMERVLDWGKDSEFPTPREGRIFRPEGYYPTYQHSIDYAILALSVAALGHDDVAKKALDTVTREKGVYECGSVQAWKSFMRKEDGFILDLLPYLDYLAPAPAQFFWALSLNQAGDVAHKILAQRVLGNLEGKYGSGGLIDKGDFLEGFSVKRVFKEEDSQFTAEANAMYALAAAAIRGRQAGQKILDAIEASCLYDRVTGLLVSDFAIDTTYVTCSRDPKDSKRMITNYYTGPRKETTTADRIYPLENVVYALALDASGSAEQGREVFRRMEQAGCYLDSGLFASFIHIEKGRPETYRGFDTEALNASVLGIITMKRLGMDEEAEQMSEALRGMPENLPRRTTGIDPAYDPSTGLLYNGMDHDNLPGGFTHNPSLNCLWAVALDQTAPKRFIVTK